MSFFKRWSLILLALVACNAFPQANTYNSGRFFKVCYSSPDSDFCTSYVAGAIDAMVESSCLKLESRGLTLGQIVRYTVAAIGISVENSGEDMYKVPVPIMMLIALRDNPHAKLDMNEYRQCVKQMYDTSKSLSLASEL